MKEPLETGSYTTQSFTNSSCGTSSNLPCFEVDSNSLLYPNAVTHTFYDALGREVETRTPGPVSGDDTVVFTLYNDSNASTLTSVPFEVASGSGYVDPATAVYVGTSTTPGGTVTFSDALGRVVAVQDPNFGSAQEPGHAYSTVLSGNYTSCTNYTLDISHVSGDSNTYETVTSVDPNDHVSVSSVDALGRLLYLQIDAGVNSTPSTLKGNERKSYLYNVLNEATSVTDTDLVPKANETVPSVTTTSQYDSMGRMTQLVDPERGTHIYTYDADSHMIADVSGSRTLGYSDDLLGRVGCVQDQTPTLSATGACTSGANPFVQNTYDTTVLGTQGSTDFPVGRLTQSKATNYFPSPDNTQGYVTEQMQYDKRGQPINEHLLISASGGTLTFPSFPTYQLALSYNDADQVTTTTTSTNPSGAGYTTTNVYDGTTGVPTGLSNNGTASANLATLSYNLNALADTMSFQTSTGTALANEQFSYDTNLRTIGATAIWLSGSGTSGSIYSQALGYDAASNLTSATSTLAAVPGQSGSGGSETEIYCYNGQNRLIWAGNSGTPQGDSNGTCGSGTPSNTLSGASYNTSYVYTQLGQLWQGPYNGGGSYQYLYCNATSSSGQHQLTGVYPSGTTCSTTSGQTQTYGASYNSWGDMKTRTATGTGGTTATLNYDGQDHLVRWQDNNSSTNEEWYMYDSSGQRILRRSQTGTGNSNTKYTMTVFGLEDHIYDGGGSSLNTKYYYALAGHLIGVLNNNGTNLLFTDALGSVVSTISNTANSASVGGNQVYGPFGNNPYSKGTMGTTKGYTGQYNDSLTQLDYYGARYYDPFVGVFLSADEVQGNFAGMNPYTYVGENPETNIDPNGEMYAPPPGSQPQGNPPPYSPPSTPWTGPLNGNNSNWQPDLCTQMNAAGNSCQVAAGVQVTTRVTSVGRGAIGGSISVGCGVSVGVVAICTGFSSAPSGPQNVEIQSTLPFRICLPTIVCSDHGNASNDAGKAESDLSGDGGPDVVASTEGQSQIPDLREQLGFPEREVDPNQDDGKTAALLNADGNTYVGASGRNWNKIKGLIPGLSNSGGHAELDALSQLVSDRNASGITGGGGIMDIDRPPCISYCVSEYGNGNVLKAVEAAQLNYLEIEYGPGYEGGVYRPGGKMTIIPEDFIGYLI